MQKKSLLEVIQVYKPKCIFDHWSKIDLNFFPYPLPKLKNLVDNFGKGYTLLWMCSQKLKFWSESSGGDYRKYKILWNHSVSIKSARGNFVVSLRILFLFFYFFLKVDRWMCLQFCKALIKQEVPNFCWDDDRILFFFSKLPLIRPGVFSSANCF